jgi:hypothetical protein
VHVMVGREHRRTVSAPAPAIVSMPSFTHDRPAPAGLPHHFHSMKVEADRGDPIQCVWDWKRILAASATLAGAGVAALASAPALAATGAVAAVGGGLYSAYRYATDKPKSDQTTDVPLESVMIHGSSSSQSLHEYKSRDDVKQLPNKAQSLAAQLFDPNVLKHGAVNDLISRVLGEGFVHWCSGGKFSNSQMESHANEIIDAKVDELAKQYPGVGLADVIAIHAYSWYADKYMREANVKNQGAHFGEWSAFAAQVTTSLRKLVRFTGTHLYRAARPGHEGESIAQGRAWRASSFLSTTYSEEARAELEKDVKYQHGDTIAIDARAAEGYHIEDFSRFSREDEVVLLPGHQLETTGQPYLRQGDNRRVIPTRAVPPQNALPPPKNAPSSVEYYENKKKREMEELRLPPKAPSKQIVYSSPSSTQGLRKRVPVNF